MTAPLSNDLRKRIVHAIDKEGMSRKAAAKRFGVARSTPIKLMQHVKKHKTYKPLKIGGWKKYTLEKHHKIVVKLLAAKPDATLKELKQSLLVAGIKVGTTSIHNYLKHIGYSFKKRQCLLVNRSEKMFSARGSGGRSTRAK